MKRIDRLFLFLSFGWNLVVYIFIPHLVWLPAFTNTYFMDNGLIYFKDFIQAHLFLPHLFLYPFLKFTNWHIETDPFIAFVTASVGALLIYHYGKKILKSTFLSLSLVFYSIFVWYASSWVQFSGEMLGGVLLLILTFEVIKTTSNNKKFPIVLGALIALTELTGQILSLSILFLLIVLFVKDRRIISKVILGGIIVVAPILIYFIANNAFGDFIYWNFTYYLNYAKLSGSTRSSLPYLEILAFYAPLVASLFTTMPKKVNYYKNIIVTTIGISAPLTIFSIFHPHHYLVSLPLMATLVGLSVQYLKGKNLLLKLTPLLFLGFFVISTIIPFYQNKFKPTPLTNLAELSRDKDQELAVSWILANTKKTDRIMVTGDPLFYVRATRLPSNNRYSALPWHYLPLSESEEIILNNLPAYWIVDENYLIRIETGWKTPEMSKFIKNTINSCYIKVFESNSWSVWKKSC